MPRVGETPYSPGALRAWANYMSRLGWHEVAAQLNAQADAAEQMQPVGSAFDTWLGGYGSRVLGTWRPQAAAPATTRPQVTGNYLGGRWNQQANQQVFPPVGFAGGFGGRGSMNPVQSAREAYFTGLQNQPVTPASYYGWNQLSNYVPSTGTTMAPGWEAPAPSREWNPWASFTTGTQAGWYAVPQTGKGSISANAEAPEWAGSTLEQAQRLGKQLEGKRLIYGSSTYGHSPAPVIGGSRKMSWAGQTKAKKNWNPWKFANRKTPTSAPLPMAASGPAGVGMVYGNANWGRP